MRHPGAAAFLEQVQGAREVGVGVGVRVLDRVAHAGLGGEMDDVAEAVGVEQPRQRRAVGEVDSLEGEAGVPAQLVEPGLLQGRVVVGAEVVDADDGDARAQQPLGQVEADEAGGARDEHRPVPLDVLRPVGRVGHSVLPLQSRKAQKTRARARRKPRLTPGREAGTRPAAPPSRAP